MIDWISKLLDHISEYLAWRKGLLPVIGMFFVFINLALQIFAYNTWLAGSQLFLHLGIIIAILGLMLAWAL